MNLEKEFHKWLEEHGYDVWTNFDNKKLWDEFVTKPSTYNFDEDDDCLVFDSSMEFLLTDEQRKEKRKAEKLKIDQIEEEYQQWRIHNHRYGSDNMKDYTDFMLEKEKEQREADFEKDML